MPTTIEHGIEASLLKSYPILLLAVIMCVLPKPLAAKEVLCIPEAPPYSSKKLGSDAILTNLVLKVFKLTEYSVTPKYDVWARLFHDADNGKCLLVGVWRNPKRDKQFLYSSKPIIKQHLGVYIRSNQTLEDTKGGVLAIERSSYVFQNATDMSYLPKELNEHQWTFKKITSIEQGIKMLLTSRVDAVYSETGHTDHLLSSNQNMADKIQKTTPIIDTKLAYIAVSKKHKKGKKILVEFDANMSIIFTKDVRQKYNWIP